MDIAITHTLGLRYLILRVLGQNQKGPGDCTSSRAPELKTPNAVNFQSIIKSESMHICGSYNVELPALLTSYYCLLLS